MDFKNIPFRRIDTKAVVVKWIQEERWETLKGVLDSVVGVILAHKEDWSGLLACFDDGFWEGVLDRGVTLDNLLGEWSQVARNDSLVGALLRRNLMDDPVTFGHIFLHAKDDHLSELKAIVTYEYVRDNPSFIAFVRDKDFESVQWLLSLADPLPRDAPDQLVRLRANAVAAQQVLL